jgi:hypothetical protein
MRKTIEFQPSTNNTALLTRSKASAFEDLVLKEAYRNFRHRFEPGKTKIRLLPAIAQDGEGQWHLKVPVLQHPSGRHAHPRTISSGAKSVFDAAYEYMKENYPNRLFSKSNKSGIRLLPSPAVACWAIVQDVNGTKLRLLVSSDYDGSRGGAAGFGHILQEFVSRYGSDETAPGHPLNPNDGVSVLIERIGGADTKFPSYRLSLTDDRGPLQPILDRVTDVEYNMLCPLEETIHITEAEAEWQLLRRLVGDDFYAEIRSAQENRQARGGHEESTPREDSLVDRAPSADETAYHPDDYKDFPARW